LACQTRVEQSGELVVEIMTQKGPTKSDPAADFRKEFAGMPLNKKLTTLIQLEMTTMSAAFDEIANRSVSFGEKLLNRIGNLKKPPAKK
jgi:hypothetical protein